MRSVSSSPPKLSRQEAVDGAVGLQVFGIPPGITNTSSPVSTAIPRSSNLNTLSKGEPDNLMRLDDYNGSHSSSFGPGKKSRLEFQPQIGIPEDDIGRGNSFFSATKFLGENSEKQVDANEGVRGEDSEAHKRSSRDAEEAPVVPCPEVLKKLLQSRGRKKREQAPPSVSDVRRWFQRLPYWRRCCCYHMTIPTLTEAAVPIILGLSSPLRTIVVIVIASHKKSVVVGGESLLTSVYRSLNARHLRPCLQRASSPSIAFLRYDLAALVNDRARPTPKRSLRVRKGILKNSDHSSMSRRRRNAKSNKFQTATKVRLQPNLESRRGSRALEIKQDNSGNLQAENQASNRSDDSDFDTEANTENSEESSSDESEIHKPEHLDNKPTCMSIATAMKAGRRLRWNDLSVNVNSTALMAVDKQVHQANTAKNSDGAADQDRVSSLLNLGRKMKAGMVLVYLEGELLYSGYPLAQYGCTREAFMGFISEVTGVVYD
ncbi:hypothetical protein FHG87_002718 [Trinorchestia longiramus]|nr:hypothetical protein FHG87_002718 [Trinorchestia longiramus]